jgi:bifunctional non-homologous end joining protein LigD
MDANRNPSGGASVDAIDYPDRLISILIPRPDVPFEALKLAAADLWRAGLAKSAVLKCTSWQKVHGLSNA